MTRQNHILHTPASEIDLPRLGRSLPKNIFSAAEVERVMMLCEIEEPIGLRDRAVLEVLYSTGMRRLEIVRLKLYDLSLDRGLLLINQGKGSKDRYVPIGVRAIAWLEKYIREGRPQLVSEPDDFTVFLTAQGEPFSRDHLTFVVKGRIDAAKLGKSGACHLFQPHDGHADARGRR
jgi:integrase/recombinase XerD